MLHPDDPIPTAWKTGTLHSAHKITTQTLVFTPLACERWCVLRRICPTRVRRVPLLRWSGHTEVELPHGFGSSPITDDERERWLKQARELVPGMLAHTKKDAPDLAHFQTKHDVEIYRCATWFSSLSWLFGTVIAYLCAK
jgi:hypothetical protein